MSNILVYAPQVHPLHKTFPSSFEVVNSLPQKFNGTILDMSLCSEKEKIQNLKDLKDLKDLGATLITEVSFLNGEKVIAECPWVEGALSLFFQGKGNFVECTSDGCSEIISSLGKSPYLVSSPGCGFTFPRILAQIINETFYALEEKMSCEEDMDRAMRFGVNYPEGPYTWYKQIGKKPVALLLDSLFELSGDHRYKASDLLLSK